MSAKSWRVSKTARGTLYTSIGCHPDWSISKLISKRVEEERKRGVMVFFTTQGCIYCAAFVRLSLGVVVRGRQVGCQRRQHAVSRAGQSANNTDAVVLREGFTRVPALLYVNETGQVVFKTDALIERQRMLNASVLVLDRAYEKGSSYQRYARSKAI